LLLIASSVTSAILETVPHLAGNLLSKVLEPVFTVMFTLEVLLRLWTCDSYKEFFTNAFNIIDILATLPCYTDLILMPFFAWGVSEDRDIAKHLSDSFQALRLADLVQVVRLLRILRVANTMRQSEMITVVIKSVWASLSGIWVLMAFMVVGMILSATSAYCVEMSAPDSGFDSIPVSIWWAATTITAVGYGDLLPKTLPGRIIAVVTMFTGVIIMAVCIAVVTNSFTIQFQRELYASRVRGLQRKLDTRSLQEIACAATCKSGGSPGYGSAASLDGRLPDQACRQSELPGIVAIRSSSRMRASSPNCGGGSDFPEADFAACVNELEEMAEGVLLGLEALVESRQRLMVGEDTSPRGSPLTRTNRSIDAGGRCARLTLDMLRSNNKLWFEQARAFSEELLLVAEPCSRRAPGEGA